jgi:hypothetical protein
MTREHTLTGPAKYLPGSTPEHIRALETTTVGQPDRVVSLPPAKAEYVRSANSVIGWDRGEDAKFSFAECSGGNVAGRSFHGRPMAASNHKLKGA